MVKNMCESCVILNNLTTAMLKILSLNLITLVSYVKLKIVHPDIKVTTILSIEASQ